MSIIPAFEYISSASSSIFILTMFLTINIYKNVKDLILNQQKVIQIKTKKLQNINKELEKRIAKEVNKNREKDKMMFQHARMIAMGEMISNIAHQWRQPLNAISVLIQGFELKKMQGKLTDDFIEQQVTEGLKLAQELSQTLDNFHNFFETGHKKDYFSIREIIEETLKFIENHEINFIIETEDIKIYCHKDNFSQVLLNLLNNSIEKFKQNKKHYNKIISISAKQIDSKVTITFIDNAGGIDEKIIDRIFEPYFTTKHKSQGTGIGLYMSEQIIEKQMRGRIWAENITKVFDNTTYKCAKFEINLPLA